MKFLLSALAATAMFFSASTAGAVEFLIVGPTSATVMPGENVTIDIRMTNVAGTEVNGLGASVTDYGANQFVNGQAIGSFFDDVCVGPQFCLGGHFNRAGEAIPTPLPVPHRELSESSIGANANRVLIVLAASLTPLNGSNPNPAQGLDGIPGTAQFTVTFTAVESAWINIGTSYQGDAVVTPGGVTIQAQGDTFQLNVIPEPGTALLIGLGLVGLTASGRRK